LLTFNLLKLIFHKLLILRMDWEEKVQAAINATSAIPHDETTAQGALIYVFIGGIFIIGRIGGRGINIMPASNMTLQQIIEEINRL